MKLQYIRKMWDELSSLKKGWDGHDAKPIKSKVMKKLYDMEFLNSLVDRFKAVGFCIKEINIVPVADGTVQVEAENKSTYLEIVVTGDEK